MSLDSNQLQAVEYLNNCLVVACPGSGKTRVIVHKVKHIIRADPGARVMVVAFTKESAQEIRQRIVEAIGHSNSRKVITGTFHSIALNQLKRANLAGTIINEGQMREYIVRALDECGLFNMDIEDAAILIEMAKLTPGYEPGNDPQGMLFTAYTNLTERNNVIDFQDMLSKSVRLMREGVIQPKTINYLLVDESQDIDEMQYAWCGEHIKAGAKLTVVGDDDQSIYKFRRALGFEGMLRFQKDFGAKIIKLDTNYRSNREIIDASVKLIKNNTSRIDKDLHAHRGDGGAIFAMQCIKVNLEAEIITSQILDTCRKNHNPDPHNYMVGVNRGEWAILARNRHNLNEIGMHLIANGIPHTQLPRNLWGEYPICLALSTLNALVPDKAAEHRKSGYDTALHFSGVDESVLIELHKQYGDDFAKLFDSGRTTFKEFGEGTASQLAAFAKYIPIWHREINKSRVNNAINGVFDWYLQYLNDSSRGKVSRGKFQRLYMQLTTAKEILTKIDGDLQKRLNRVMGQKKKKNEDSTEGAGVFLGTFHGSKGLEFDNVWLAAVEEGIMPDMKHIEQWEMSLHEEERRLMYVAMTRAKNHLYMSCLKQPSSFLGEIEIEILGRDEQEYLAPSRDTLTVK